MVSRRDLKRAHEETVLRQFEKHLGDTGVSLNILARPEPPEAIVEIDRQRTWIEITDAFLDKKHAIGLTSGACDDVEHAPDDRRLILDPDATFSNVLYSVIKAKQQKKSMHAIAAAEGPGILLVGIFTPFATAKSVSEEEAVAVSELISSHTERIFKTIYAYDGTGRREFHILYSLR